MLIPLLCYCYSNYHESRSTEGTIEASEEGPSLASERQVVLEPCQSQNDPCPSSPGMGEEKDDDLENNSSHFAAAEEISDSRRICDEEQHDSFGNLMKLILPGEEHEGSGDEDGVEIVSMRTAETEVHADGDSSQMGGVDTERLSLSLLLGQQKRHQGLVCLFAVSHGMDQFIVSSSDQSRCDQGNHFLGATYPYPKYDTRYQGRLKMNDAEGQSDVSSCSVLADVDSVRKEMQGSPLCAWV
eukprot:scaffold12324_cov144-Cylindrotheca_fusiformis.AAC.5